MSKIFLSVIIPAYNEKNNFQNGALTKVSQYFQNFPKDYEVIIVDDGSNDNSPDLIAKFCQNNKNFRLIKNKHMGKAGTVARGVTEAKGEYILFSDFDQATPISEWEKLYPYLQKKYHVVIGSR